MKPSLDTAFIYVIAIMLVAISMDVLPFWVVLAALVIRLIYADTHTVGVFLLMFGGVLGSTIRFEMPFLPIYGLILNFFGLWLVKDTFRHFKYESASIQMMAIVLIYFFLAYVLSPNINDIRATTKIQGLIMNGAMMFVAYYTIVHSSKIENEILTQCLFLASILFLVHNMNLLGIRPNNFFDYEWHRKGAGLLLGMKNDDLYMKFVNYQVVGMNTLFGISMYLAKLKNTKPKIIIYSLIALQLVLTSGARQAIFGTIIIILLYLTVFNSRNLLERGNNKKIVYLLIGAAAFCLLLQILPMLEIDYISETLDSGDKGREMLLAMGWNLFLRNPLLGSGVGGFNHAYPGMLYPHNFFIEVLCECGVLGVAFLIAMLVAHFRYQRLNVLFLTENKTFIFLIVAALGMRVMVSDDLTASIGLFSAFFACTLTEPATNNSNEDV